MSVIERTITVTFRHRVYFTSGVFDTGNPLLRDVLLEGQGRRSARALVIVDAGLSAAQPELIDHIRRYFEAPGLELVTTPVVVPGGEQVKNATFHVADIHALVERHRIDRHSYVVAVGGGAVLDMVGLAASTAHRGVRHVRVPSTTLSQNDSGVGVKNGINAFGKKNFLGTFGPPFAVINDLALLATLTPRDKRSGFAEAVKVACIRDRSFFEQLERDADRLAAFDPDAVASLVRRCAELHLNHVATSGDPFELGSARPLDFGHWAAHKLEQLSHYRLRHGEAVAIGIAIDILVSRHLPLLDASSAARVLDLLERLGFELFTPELLQTDAEGAPALLAGLDEFREHLGGELTITLLDGIGHGIEVHEIPAAAVHAAIDELDVRHRRRNDASRSPEEVSATPSLP